MGREEILKAQIAIPCQRPSSSMPEGVTCTPTGEPRMLEPEVRRPKKGRNTSIDQRPPIAVPRLSVQDPPNGAHAAAVSHFTPAKAGRKAREAEEAA